MPLAAPTSTDARLDLIAAAARSFIYCVSVTGVTGARAKLPPEILSNVKAIKALTDKPVAVGFGVSNAGQASSVARAADGVIVGSAIVKIIATRKRLIPKVSSFVKKIAKSVHGI